VQPAEILAVQLEAERARAEVLAGQVEELRRQLETSERRLDAAERERGQMLALLEAAQPPRLEDRAWRWRWWKRG
jgi:hypothetical protein